MRQMLCLEHLIGDILHLKELKCFDAFKFKNISISLSFLILISRKKHELKNIFHNFIAFNINLKHYFEIFNRN